MKLNRLRNLALGLVFFGLFILIFGAYFRAYQLVIATLFIIGTLCCLVSVVMYFWLGAISMRIPQVQCPKCQRFTKVMGTDDGCMFCGTPVSILHQA